MNDQPILRVVHGSPDDAELAALTAVVLAVATESTPVDEPAPPSRWADRAALMPRRIHPGAGAWRASGLPG